MMYLLRMKNIYPKCREGYLNTKCVRCEYPLILRIDPTDTEEYTYMILEKN